MIILLLSSAPRDALAMDCGAQFSRFMFLAPSERHLIELSGIGVSVQRVDSEQRVLLRDLRNALKERNGKSARRELIQRDLAVMETEIQRLESEVGSMTARLKSEVKGSENSDPLERKVHQLEMALSHALDLLEEDHSRLHRLNGSLSAMGRRKFYLTSTELNDLLDAGVVWNAHLQEYDDVFKSASGYLDPTSRGLHLIDDQLMDAISTLRHEISHGWTFKGLVDQASNHHPEALGQPFGFEIRSLKKPDKEGYQFNQYGSEASAFRAGAKNLKKRGMDDLAKKSYGNSIRFAKRNIQAIRQAKEQVQEMLKSGAKVHLEKDHDGNALLKVPVAMTGTRVIGHVFQLSLPPRFFKDPEKGLMEYFTFLEMVQRQVIRLNEAEIRELRKSSN